MAVMKQILTIFLQLKNGSEVDSEQELSFHRAIAYTLSSVIVVLLPLTMLINVYEGTETIYFPRFVTLGIGVMSFLWIHYKGTHAPVIVLILNITLMLFGALLLLLERAAPSDSVLFWFIILPPILMVSLGLRLGSILFFAFYAFLAVVFFSPLGTHMPRLFSGPVKVRFMLALFGAYFFSCWAEFLRHKTQGMLMRAMAAFERESQTDSLTGAANRRAFYSAFPRVMAGCLRTRKTYALAFLDVDYFKRINDTLGHQTGDCVLRHLAGIITEQIRNTDYLFRWGGEEFAVIMPDCCPQQALGICERIRAHVEQTPCQDNGCSVPITISIGLYCGDETQDMELPVRTADHRLYAAKESGRNKVVVGQKEMEDDTPGASVRPVPFFLYCTGEK